MITKKVPNDFELPILGMGTWMTGGEATDLHGNEQRYDQPIKGAIVSNGLVHDELVGLVKGYL